MANSTIEKRQDKIKESLVAILKEMPIIEVAVKKSGIGRDTFYRWRREDKEFRRQCEDALRQGFEYINDMSESQVITLIKEKKMPAITLWLKHHHPLYGSRVKSYAPITPAEDLTPEENLILTEALKLASGKVINVKKKNHGRNTVATDQRK